jgi:hypothetical protein
MRDEVTTVMTFLLCCSSCGKRKVHSGELVLDSVDNSCGERNVRPKKFSEAIERTRLVGQNGLHEIILCLATELSLYSGW